MNRDRSERLPAVADASAPPRRPQSRASGLGTSGRLAPITLLTDFGLRDAYVGAMKGVIASIAPDVDVIDICHEVEPQNVRRAGLVWAAAAPCFPPGTIHVGVVDPGVGTARKVLAFRSARAIFLAPDNGLIGYVLDRRRILDVFRVERRELFRESVSDTFHGRDIFAPVAAFLARGGPLEAVGPRARRFRHEGVPRPRRRRAGGIIELRGEVIDIDRFGNATTNIRPPAPEGVLDVTCGGLREKRLRRAYGDVRAGRALALVGSTETIEIAVSGGSAQRELGIEVGDPVVARWREIRGASRRGSGGSAGRAPRERR